MTSARRPGISLVSTSSTYAPSNRVLSKARLADIALLLTYVSITSLFVKSATLLEHMGYHYITPGGFPWEKFHPGTILACCALLVRILAADDVKAEARRLLVSDPLMALYVTAIFIAAAHAVLISKNPATGLVDTLLLPVILLALTKDLDPRIRRSLGLMACAIMGLNACVGLVEFLSGWRLVPVAPAGFVMPDPSRPLDPDANMGVLAALSDWRSTALLGHPLENAFMTGTIMLCLAAPGARWISPLVRFPLMGLSLVAMAAFGGRSSLVLSVLGMALFGAIAVARHLAAGAAIPKRGAALMLFALPIACALIFVVAQAGFFDKFIMRFIEDSGSAEARIYMWQMFEPFTVTQILLGPDPEVARVQQHLIGLDLGIESFWIGLTLAYGLIVASMLFIGLGLLAWRVVTISGPGAAAIMVYYFVNASTSTSLSSKTTTFGLVVLLVVLILQADRRSDILIPGLYAWPPKGEDIPPRKAPSRPKARRIGHTIRNLAKAQTLADAIIRVGARCQNAL